MAVLLEAKDQENTAVVEFTAFQRYRLRIDPESLLINDGKLHTIGLMDKRSYSFLPETVIVEGNSGYNPQMPAGTLNGEAYFPYSEPVESAGILFLFLTGE